VQVKLAAAWGSFMFPYVDVDILGIDMPGVIEDILAGVVFVFQIDQAWAVGALALVAIPILMVVASVSLPARINRAVNLVVASLDVVVSTGNAVGESWTVYDALVVGLEAIVLAVILGWAWAWPRTAVATREAGRADGDDLNAAGRYFR
jgi:hypothetical protein